MRNEQSAGDDHRRRERRRARWLHRVVLASMAVVSLAASGPGADGEVVSGPVTITADGTGLLRVDGERHYRGSIELLAEDDGVLLVNELPLEEYVDGVAEMPGRWPMEALKAQAVAARTYAWYVAEQDSYEHYDICATTACQVFHGADTVVHESAGGRWRQAVDDTAGEVLVGDDGEPILARYFSTSGGRTYPNHEVFPESGRHPYLVAVDDPYDEVSPYHRWVTRFTRAEFEAILSRGETLHAAVPIASVERSGPERDPGAVIEVTGVDGTEISVGAVEFATFVSRVAPSLFPDRFPGLRADGLHRLPSTVPSSRFAVGVRGDEVTLHGQGWGHGVGMGQYGARGRAEDGHGYRAILAAYYGGLEPVRVAKVPDRIRVGIGGSPEVRISADTTFTIRSSEGVIEDRALGLWTVEREGPGVRLTPPPSVGEPIELAPLRPAAGALDDSGLITFETELNKAALLRLEVVDAEGESVLSRDLGAVEPGTQAVTWSYAAADGEPVEAGEYVVTLVAEDADGVSGRTSMPVSVGSDALPDAVDAPGTQAEVSLSAVLVVALVASFSLLAWLMIRSRRS